MRSLGGRMHRGLALIALAAMALLVPGRSALALPVFARQTGMPCEACHIGSFGPQLTPLGIAFKLGGYTMQAGSGIASKIPLSAMAFSSFTHTNDKQPSPPAADFRTNDNFALDQISLFLAGRATNYAGGFVQATYSGIDHSSHLDNTDLRLTSPFNVSTNTLQLGVDLNNNPTVQDPYNTTYAWSFPYVSSALAPVPGTQPLLAGALAGNSVGITAYAWWNQSLYAEFGGYRSLDSRWVSALGETPPPGFIRGVAPYLRLAYQKQWNGQLAEVGFLGFYAPLAEASFGTPGTNSYLDYGIDGTYQFLGNGKNVVSLYAILLQESQNLAAAYNAGAASRIYHRLDQLRTNLSYYFDETYGLTLGYVNTVGSRDPILYAPAPVTGSRTGTPDSQAIIAQLDWTPFGKSDSWAEPWVNLRLGLQYTYYLEFNGAGSNYDGYGRSASGNNTLYGFAWIAF